ncbi:MAG: CarD family transcriptional regulator [Pelagibacteraceae bacterium]
MLKKLKQSLLKVAGQKEKKTKPLKSTKAPKNKVSKKVKSLTEKKTKPVKILKEKKVKITKEKKEIKNTASEIKNQTSSEKPAIKTGRVYTSQQDPLVEITKIKKQDNEKRIYKIKDYVIYPKHGIGQIVAVEKDTIAGIEINFYKIEITKDKLVLTIPTNQQSHLRPISSINQINKAISILKGKAKVKRTMWSRRAQEYEQKINSGEIYQIAEVVRDLNKNTDMPVDQSYSERQLFEKAFERLLGEVTIVLAVPEEEAKEKLNKALGKTPEKNLVE